MNALSWKIQMITFLLFIIYLKIDCLLPVFFLIKMRDGRNVRCVHNNPTSQPVIVLKMEDRSDLFLPIIVCKFSFREFAINYFIFLPQIMADKGLNGK